MNKQSEKEYQEIAEILANFSETRKDNRKLIKTYYKQIWGISVDEAFERDDVPNYQTIERKARLLKDKNPFLRYDKSKEVDRYKEMALELPVAVRII